MAFELVEQWDSRKLHLQSSDSTATLRFTLNAKQPVLDENDVLNSIADYMPDTFQGLYLQSCDVSDDGNGVWKISGEYGLLSVGGVAAVINTTSTPVFRETKYTLSTTGGTVHIDAARELMQSNPAGPGLTTDRKLIIGEDDEGNVQGVDIVVPREQYSINTTMSRDDFSPAYRIKLRTATGKVNDADWRDWKQREVLFMGAEATWQGSHDVEITYQFVISPEEIARVGDLSDPGFIKGGWDIVDIHYQKEEEPVDGKNFTRQVPYEAFILRVYDEYDFNLLEVP